MFEVGTNWLYNDCGYKHRLTILSREDAVSQLGEQFVRTTDSSYTFCYDALTGTVRAVSKEELKKKGRELSEDAVQVPWKPTNLLEDL